MRRGLVLATTVMGYAALYAPQPLLPLLARRFETSEATAALLITATLVPLSFAPLSYGSLLLRVSPGRLMRAAALALAGTELLFALAGSFPLLLGVRLLQGLLLPALFTSLMTYIAEAAAPAQRSRDMARYVAASILGGYLGRLLAGLGAAWAHWSLVFLMLALGLLLVAVPLGRLHLPQRAAQRPGRPGPGAALRMLRDGGRTRVFALVFLLFFTFAALLNFLPFRVAEIEPERADLWSGLVYTGYLLGVVTALGSGRIAVRLGGEPRALMVGFGVFTAALAATAAGSAWILFGALFAFCGAMFLVHAVAAGMANRGAGEWAGVANGLYLASYYSGGVLGSFLPGLVYQRFGWSAFVAVLFGVAALGMALAASLRHAAGVAPDR